MNNSYAQAEHEPGDCVYFRFAKKSYFHKHLGLLNIIKAENYLINQ